MKQLTNLLLAGNVKEGRKSRRKCSSIDRAEMKATGELMMRFWRLHSPVMRSRHQENGRKFDAGRDKNHKMGS